jgi:hypothetical protein
MKTNQQKQIATSAAVVALIILFKCLLAIGLNILAFRLPPAINTTLYLFFPHEIFFPLRYLLLDWTRNYLLSSIQLFSILFAVFLIIAYVQFRDKQKKMPLQVACYILLLSILFAIPPRITYYQYAVNFYKSYVPSVNKDKGILAIIDDFFARPSKPSLPLLIAELAILLLYMGWAVWVLKQLYAAKRTTNQPTATGSGN